MKLRKETAAEERIYTTTSKMLFRLYGTVGRGRGGGLSIEDSDQ